MSSFDAIQEGQQALFDNVDHTQPSSTSCYNPFCPSTIEFDSKILYMDTDCPAAAVHQSANRVIHYWTDKEDTTLTLLKEKGWRNEDIARYINSQYPHTIRSPSAISKRWTAIRKKRSNVSTIRRAFENLKPQFVEKLMEEIKNISPSKDMLEEDIKKKLDELYNNGLDTLKL
ncbi:hypothetical protein ACEPPN_019325 [Leptodophora sp. 'Broadleaf-Isolate-01']